MCLLALSMLQGIALIVGVLIVLLVFDSRVTKPIVEVSRRRRHARQLQEGLTETHRSVTQDGLTEDNPEGVTGNNRLVVLYTRGSSGNLLQERLEIKMNNGSLEFFLFFFEGRLVRWGTDDHDGTYPISPEETTIASEILKAVRKVSRPASSA